MRLTKNDMARVIIQALYNIDKLPDSNNINVIRMAKNKKDLLQDHYTKAINTLNNKIKNNRS